MIAEHEALLARVTQEIGLRLLFLRGATHPLAYLSLSDLDTLLNLARAADLLVGALAFYAQEKNWTNDEQVNPDEIFDTAMSADRHGTAARTALAAYEAATKEAGEALAMTQSTEPSAVSATAAFSTSTPGEAALVAGGLTQDAHDPTNPQTPKGGDASSTSNRTSTAYEDAPGWAITEPGASMPERIWAYKPSVENLGTWRDEPFEFKTTGKWRPPEVTEYIRADLVRAPASVEAAYKQGWNDREADFLERAERVLPPTSAESEG